VGQAGSSRIASRISGKSWIVRVEHLALRPFLSTVARGATVLEYRPSSVTRCRVSGLRQERGAHRLHPQRLGVEGITRPLRDAVVVDGGFGGLPANPIPPCTARELLLKSVLLPRWRSTALFSDHPGYPWRRTRQGERLAWPIGKDPGHPIGQAVRMTGAAAAPAITRGFAFIVERTTSRICVSKMPLSGMPRAVKNASFPTSTMCSKVSGRGGSPAGISRVRTVLVSSATAVTETFTSLFA